MFKQLKPPHRVMPVTFKPKTCHSSGTEEIHLEGYLLDSWSAPSYLIFFLLFKPRQAKFSYSCDCFWGKVETYFSWVSMFGIYLYECRWLASPHESTVNKSEQAASEDCDWYAREDVHHYVGIWNPCPVVLRVSKVQKLKNIKMKGGKSTCLLLI